MRRSRKLSRVLVGSALILGGLGLTAAPASATHVPCGSVITANTTLDSNLGPCPGDGLIVVADNVTIDLNGFTITAANGAGDNAGVTFGRLAAPPTATTPEVTLMTVNGGTVKNGTIEGFDAGVVLAGGAGHTVQNVTLRNNVNDGLAPPCNLGEGIAVFNSDDNRILDNTLNGNGPFGGISLIEDSDRNLISGNVLIGHNLRGRTGSGCGNNNQSSSIRIEGNGTALPDGTGGASDNIVKNNRVEGSGLAGIALHGYVCVPGPRDGVGTDPNTGNVIQRNTVLGGEQDGISILQQGPAAVVCPAFGNTIERNVSSNNVDDGIFVAANTYDNVISKNVTNNNDEKGINLNDPRFGNTFTNVGPSQVQVTSPAGAPLAECTSTATPGCAEGTFFVLSGSGSGNVTARLVPVGPVDVTAPIGLDSVTSGCSPTDFVGFPTGAVALIQRGSCGLAQKVTNAVAAGASAVIIFNEGSTGRTGVLTDGVSPTTIPVIGVSFATGQQLYNQTLAGPVTIRVVTNTTNVQFLAAPAPFNNTLIGNQGTGNALFDGYDGNLTPPCDNNKWRASKFGTVNQSCVVGPGGSGTAKGRTGERPGNPDHGKDVGEVRGKSAGSRLDS